MHAISCCSGILSHQSHASNLLAWIYHKITKPLIPYYDEIPVVTFIITNPTRFEIFSFPLQMIPASKYHHHSTASSTTKRPCFTTAQQIHNCLYWCSSSNFMSLLIVKSRMARTFLAVNLAPTPQESWLCSLESPISGRPFLLFG